MKDAVTLGNIRTIIRHSFRTDGTAVALRAVVRDNGAGRTVRRSRGRGRAAEINVETLSWIVLHTTCK
jgi:hypothetical protein